MPEVTCNRDGCDETLRMDEHGRGEGILRGGGLFCDAECYQRHRVAEWLRTLVLWGRR